MAEKMSVRQLVSMTAETTVKHAIAQLQQSASGSADCYKAMEELLHLYPVLKRLYADPAQYHFFPDERSHDIVVQPPKGTVALDKVDAAELFVEARKRSYVRTMARFAELEAVIQLFKNRREFCVIRMWYFGEDAHGSERSTDAERLTWEQIAEELEAVGISRSPTMLRRWRNALVKEMTVAMFGVDGALSVVSG